MQFFGCNFLLCAKINTVHSILDVYYFSTVRNTHLTMLERAIAKGHSVCPSVHLVTLMIHA